VNPVTLQRHRATTALLSIVTAFVWAHPAPAEERLYESDGVLPLTIHGPLAKLARSAEDADDVPGMIELEDGTTVPMSFTKFGISRLRECGVPSLAITLDPTLVRGTVFEGQKKLWLVTPCQHYGSYDKYTVLEYLIYRSFAEIAEHALHARLVSLRYQDTQRRSKDHTEYAFILEDIGHAAARTGRTWLDVQTPDPAAYDPAQLATMSLFQYMIGNTDWSALAGPAGKRCCHNVALFGSDDGGSIAAVPHDFDQAGAVNPPYAIPAAELKIRKVTDRLYRGFCFHTGPLPAVIEAFNDHRPEIEKLFNQEDLPYPEARRYALTYLDGFYQTINDPKKLKKKIINHCR
jgi:hypothetical protein